MTKQESQYYDNTKISTYKDCPRKYLIRHILNWTIASDLKPIPLVFGSSWHAGMDAIWGNNTAPKAEKVDLAMEAFLKQWQEDGYSSEPSLEEQENMKARTPGTAHEMYYEYVNQRERMLEESTTLGIEQPVALPFPGLLNVWYIGKLDKVIDFNGIHILEHKTTSLYRIKGNFDTNYLLSWDSASQIKGYQLCGHAYYPELQDVWIDCALVHKKVHNAFKFIPVAHNWKLLESWMIDTRRWIQDIQKDIKEFKEVGNLEKGTFRKNENSCYGRYGKCAFLDICGTCSDPTALKEVPLGYMIEKWEPFKVLKLEQLLNNGETT